MFLKNVLKLTVGNVTAQIISLAAVPIITRIYSPGDYGTFAICLSIITILLPVSTFRFNSAMMLPEKRNDAANLLCLSLLSVIGFSLLVLIVVVFMIFGDILPKAWYLKGVTNYLWLVPLAVLIQGFAQSIMFWALRNKMFNNMVVARITETISDKGFVLTAGFVMHAGPIGLIGGRIVGPFFALCYLVQRSLSPGIKVLWRTLSFARMERLARRYKEFLIFATLAFLVDSASREIPVLLLASLYSPIISGFYILAMRVTVVPMRLIGDSIYNAFLQKATGNREKGVGLANDTIKLFGYMIYLSLPPVLIILFFGESLFRLVFGSEWSVAGVYAQILSLSLLAGFLHRPLSVLFIVYERQKQRLMFDSCLTFARVGTVIGVAYTGNSVHIAILGLTASTCIVYTCAYIYLFGLVGVNARQILGIFASKIVMMGPLIIGLALSRVFIYKHYLVVAMILVSIPVLQWIYLSIFFPHLKKELGSIFSIFSNRKFFIG